MVSPFAMFSLVCAWFVSSLLLLIFHLGKCLHHEHCLDYTYSYFFKQEVLRRQVVHGSSRVNIHETMRRKNKCKLNFFSIFFVWNNEEIHFSFKNSEVADTWWHIIRSNILKSTKKNLNLKKPRQSKIFLLHILDLIFKRF